MEPGEQIDKTQRVTVRSPPIAFTNRWHRERETWTNRSMDGQTNIAVKRPIRLTSERGERIGQRPPAKIRLLQQMRRRWTSIGNQMMSFHWQEPKADEKQLLLFGSVDFSLQRPSACKYYCGAIQVFWLDHGTGDRTKLEWDMLCNIGAWPCIKYNATATRLWKSDNGLGLLMNNDLQATLRWASKRMCSCCALTVTYEESKVDWTQRGRWVRSRA